jgi:hypothetical protein
MQVLSSHGYVCGFISHKSKVHKGSEPNLEARHAMPFEATADKVDCKYPATTPSYDMNGRDVELCLKNNSIKYGIKATGGKDGCGDGA